MKKIAIILLLTLPIGLFAQDKFAHINTQDLIPQMPEYTEIQKVVEDLAKQFEDELLKMREEYYAKVKEYQEKQATMPESIKEARQTEIMEIEQRIQTTQQVAQNDIQKKQETLFAPVIERVKNAIDQVGKENGYTYIFDLATQSIIYTSDKAVDATPLVKTKLGIK